MTNLENEDIDNLVVRYNQLIDKYIPLTVELATKLEKFGKIKQELQIISAEFVRRGFDPKTPDSLLKIIEQELQNRNIK